MNGGARRQRKLEPAERDAPANSGDEHRLAGAEASPEK